MPAQHPPTLFLIDGYALIYRAFYAMISRPLRTTRGENTSAVWGVANFLHRLLERHEPTYLAWVHDAGTTFRNDIYPEYKATREKLDEELQQDFDQSLLRIEQLIAAFQLRLVTVEGYEADDVIGTLVGRAAPNKLRAVIVSGDKDFYQLISDSVYVLNPGRGGPSPVDEQMVGPSNAKERFGVPPERVVDYLALVGDASDNVPGVPGIGDKTARALIGQYGDIEAILASAHSISGKRAREGLLGHAEAARLSRALVTIRRDVPVDLNLESLRVGVPDHHALARLYRELEFHTLMDRLGSTGGDEPQPTDYRLVSASSELAAMVRELHAATVVALRTKVDGVGPRATRVVGLALGVPGGRAWYLPLRHGPRQGELGVGDTPANLPALGDEAMRPVVELLGDVTVPKVGHDLKADWLALRNDGVELRGVAHDVMLASFVLDPGRRGHDLPGLAREHLHVESTPDEALVGKGKSLISYREVSPQQAAAQCCAEAQVTLQLRERNGSLLDARSARRLLETIELPLIGVLVDMEWRGIAVDVERLGSLSREFAAELAEIERHIIREAGTEFNINSTPQLRHVLFEKLQLPVIKKTKTGPSADADVLRQLAELGFDVPRLLLSYRELSKLKSTYVDPLPEAVDSVTGRVHTSFNQTGAATGRLSSSDPNLQNIPVRTSRGQLIRQCFVPAPKHRFIVADYSQVELRVLAHLSQDEAFIAAFRRGGDIHAETAAVIFEVEVDEVTPQMRARAKTINFATIYGQGAFSLAGQLGISQDEAREFITLYFERFAGVRRFLDDTVESAKRNGYVETLFGRRRYIPELKDPNYNVRAFGERTAMNSPMQGSAADIIKLAMVGLARSLAADEMAAAMLLQVHDELVLEVPDGEVERAVDVVRREMEGAAQLRVPLVVDIGVGPNWLDAKG